jgi:hypothetical protein
MSMANTFSDENTISKLILPSNFETHYIVNTKNEYKMGIQNPVLKLETTSEILFIQEVKEKSILNTIETLSIKGNTDNDNMKPGLDQMLLLADISKQIVIKRDSNGKMKSLVNLEKLKYDWEEWKKTKLQKAFPELKHQEVFAKNYENGLDKMNEGIKKSFQYQVLLPEIYNLNNQNIDSTSETEIVSKLIAEMVIRYKLIWVKKEIDFTTIAISLKSIVTNKDDLKNNYARPLYEKHPKFSISDYRFKIIIDYTFDKVTFKMLNAHFSFLEQIHDNLQYKLEIDLKEVDLK